MGEPTPNIREIFCAAIEIASDVERSDYVTKACGDDAPKAARLEKLLAAHFQVGEFLESVAPGLPAKRFDDLTVGTVIGQYKLLQQVGEGGMGTVFMAEQLRPIKRTVAIKIIKVGMDTRQVIARFDAERQTLAMMDHPNIARVIDAGATDHGRPYFVMELVQGVRITEYCDQHHQTIPQRLQLFEQVCQAVQHAHHKGVIHRDIKPSNVLVKTQDEKPLAKVIDFGIAKAMQSGVTEKTLFTEFQQLIGTPEYMSPEQADGSLDIDTRTDVYSLGVLLYELLVGAPPFNAQELRSKAYGEIQRVIREVDPLKPSTRLSRLSKTPALSIVAIQRGTEPRRLNATIRGELDWIVMKCLEKDRTRRYESPSALAADISHHLSDEPVSAASPSQAYRIRKFVRRNRVPVFASVAVLAALLAGTIGTTVGMIGQSRQRAIADQQRSFAEQERAEAQNQAKQAKRNLAIADAISRFQADMLASADPNRLLGDNLTVVQTMNAAVKELDAGKLKDQPMVEAFVRHTIGNTFRTLGRYDSAEPNLRKALELWRAGLPAGDGAISISLNDLAVLLQAQAKLSEAEPLYREALAINRKALPAGHTEIASNLNNLAALLQDEGKLDEAEPLLREAVEIRRKSLPAGDGNIALVLNNLAFVLRAEGKLAEAESVFREALEIFRAALPAGHPNTATAAMNLGLVLQDEGELAEAEPLFRKALETYRSALPAGHPLIASALTNLGVLLQDQKQPTEAEPLMRQALEMRRKSLPPAHPDIATSLYDLASVLEDQNRTEDAAPLYQEALEIRRKALPAGNGLIARTLLELGVVLTKLNRLSEAESALLEAERSFAIAPGAHRRAHEQCCEALSKLYAAWDNSEPGKGYLEKAAQWQRMLPSTRPTTVPKSA